MTRICSALNSAASNSANELQLNSIIWNQIRFGTKVAHTQLLRFVILLLQQQLQIRPPLSRAYYYEYTAMGRAPSIRRGKRQPWLVFRRHTICLQAEQCSERVAAVFLPFVWTFLFLLLLCVVCMFSSFPAHSVYFIVGCFGVLLFWHLVKFVVIAVVSTSALCL